MARPLAVRIAAAERALAELKARQERTEAPAQTPRDERRAARRARDAAICRLYQEGRSTLEVARAMRCALQTVQAVLTRAGIDPRERYAAARETHAKRRAAAIAMHHEGKTASEIGRAFGVTRERARQWLAASGIAVDRISRSLPRPSCEVCGKEVRTPHAKTCSPECRATRNRHAYGPRMRDPEWQGKLAAIRAMRAGGVSWKEIGLVMGFDCSQPGARAQISATRFAHYERQNGLDMDAATPAPSGETAA